MRRVCVVIAALACTQAMATPLFDDNSVIEVTLTGPFGTLFADTESRDELPFTLSAAGIDHRIEVRLRGRSRLRVCDFPPLRLDFRAKHTGGTVFQGQDKLKLVTHCRNYDRGEQDILEEFAAYRIFNLLTDNSYRVRLLRFRYEDSDGTLSDRASPRYGFLIESGEDLADRLGGMRVDLPGVPSQRYDHEQAALVFVFEYLIGNTDWGFVKAPYDAGCCHNGDLIDVDDSVYFIPYDFDLAGLVNADYAYPDPLLKIKRVTQRLYRGVCEENDRLSQALQMITNREAGILQVLQEIPGLTQDSIETGTKFLAAFFQKAAAEEKLLRSFEKRCI